MNSAPDRTVSVAPMMDCTDRHCRYFHRLLAPDVLLYTEMITARAVLSGDTARLLAYDEAEHPVALQLGGSDPRELAAAARIGAEAGYDEINLNVGCPSSRVSAAEFGACLMKRPGLVAECVAALVDSVQIPVTVKTRIGVDEYDDYDFLRSFIDKVYQSGPAAFIVHARKAWLSGLSPRENRTVPPLCPERVYRLKQDFGALEVVINGGIDSVSVACDHLRHVDGVMIGRRAYDDPWLLTEMQSLLDGGHPGDSAPSRLSVIRSMAGYASREVSRGTRLRSITRHMLGLFRGQPGARAWRRFLSMPENDHRRPDEVLQESLRLLPGSAGV